MSEAMTYCEVTVDAALTLQQRAAPLPPASSTNRQAETEEQRL